MAKEADNKSFYAVEGEGPRATSAQSHELAKVQVGEGGEASTHYACQATLTVSLDNEDETNDMATVLKTGDAFIKFTGSTGVSGLSDSNLDLSSDGKEYTATVNFALDGTTTKSATISGDVWIVNRTELQEVEEDNGVQNYLAGKNLKVKVTIDTFSCDTVTGD